ncbi:MAG: ergothioneine biosynthesis protein EgtB [Parvularculaceae bacterium]|nr:ergothioneine biosynthesis protein EgtB [Parvularculaceae bacterium]
MQSMSARRERSRAADRDSLLRQFQNARKMTKALVAPLSAEDCVIQSMPDASPAKWHLAHTTWFFETFILLSIEGCSPFDDAYQQLFNSYYNQVGAQFPRPARGMLSRPSLERVLEYRESIDREISDRFDSLSAAALALVELGINHEQQHQELILTDVKHLLSLNPTAPKYCDRWPLGGVSTRAPDWRGFDGGVFEIGADGRAFHFDNEGPRHMTALPDFELATHPVTNAQFLEFIEDGGYDCAEHWLDAGWQAINQNAWRAPLYWKRCEAGWRCFTLHGDAPLDPHAPVCHLSFYEADAYARWAGARLPTEAEWEIASLSARRSGNFLESGVYHPTAPKLRSEPQELVQMFGDVWEWTRSDYAPYPGFQPAAGAVGEYNGKFMSGQYVLRGGSCATPADHIRPTYRNFFPAAARWQFSGLRLARDASSPRGARRNNAGEKSSPVFYKIGGVQREDERVEIERDLMRGIARISPKYFYDYIGSQLFETITRLPEYYIPEAEAEIFETNADAMAAAVRRVLGDDYQIVDLGAGNCEKAEKLLPAFQPARYIAVDISAEFLEAAVGRVHQRFPEIPMAGVGTDFSESLDLPEEMRDMPTLAFFPGSSLGNFEDAKAQRLLRSTRDLNASSAILLGVDLVKETQTLEAAYDDATGVTAAFNRNILRHVNRIIGADFDPAAWRHVAFFNEDESRIEMHLEAKEEQTVTWKTGRRRFEKNERILTEYSRKWRIDGLDAMLRRAGFERAGVWTDSQARFAVALGAAGKS